MKMVGIHELTNRINEILRMVEEGESFEVTDHGEVIARLIPGRGFPSPSSETTWTDIDLLATEIGAHIPEKVDSVDIINNMRRDL